MTIIIIVILLIILSCFYVYQSNQKNDSDDEIIIKDNVSVITNEKLKEEFPISVSDNELTFIKNPNYKKNDIIVAGITDKAPNGFIRKVIDIEKKNNEYIIKTENAYLTDVFEKVSVIKSFELTEEGLKELDDNEVAASENIENDIHIKNLNSYHDNNDIKVKKLLSLEDDIKYQFSKDFEYKLSDEMKINGALGFNLKIDIELKINHDDITFGIVGHNEVYGEISLLCEENFNKELYYEFFNKSLPNIQFFIGFVPVVITNDISGDVTTKINNQGYVENSFKVESKNSAGFKYTSKNNKVKEIKKNKYDTDGLEWNTETRFESDNSIEVMLNLTTKLYGSTGAEIGIGVNSCCSGKIITTVSDSSQLNFIGSVDLSISPQLEGKLIVTIPIIDERLVEMELFKMKLKPFWEKSWKSDKKWESNNDEEIDETEKELNLEYVTKWSEVNQITYPSFIFNYSDNWTVDSYMEYDREIVTLTNERGVRIEYSVYHLGDEFLIGGSNASMTRVEITKECDSNFVPGYVQAGDYSHLGKFIVAKIHQTGRLNMQTDSEFTEIDGPISYAVLPESRLGVNDCVRRPYFSEFSYKYASHVSFISYSPDGRYTDSEKEEILKILASFRIK